MATRHTARVWALQALYALDFNLMPVEQVLENCWAGKTPDERTRRFATELTDGVRSRMAELDMVIRRYAANWDFERISAVERNILRLALFEMLHRADVPAVVAINEAVELAKQFSGEEAGKFVNGILDKARLAAEQDVGRKKSNSRR